VLLGDHACGVVSWPANVSVTSSFTSFLVR
jgi:hypothetical protein